MQRDSEIFRSLGLVWRKFDMNSSVPSPVEEPQNNYLSLSPATTHHHDNIVDSFVAYSLATPTPTNAQQFAMSFTSIIEHSNCDHLLIASI